MTRLHATILARIIESMKKNIQGLAFLNVLKKRKLRRDLLQESDV